MTKCYLDSNVLVYFKNELSPHHKTSRKLINDLIKKGVSLYISPLVIDEFIYSFYKYLLVRNDEGKFPALKTALDDISRLPMIEIVCPPTDWSSEKEIISFMEKYGLRPRDAFHLLTALSNGIDTFATFDNDFQKVFRSKIMLQLPRAQKS